MTTSDDGRLLLVAGWLLCPTYVRAARHGGPGCMTWGADGGLSLGQQGWCPPIPTYHAGPKKTSELVSGTLPFHPPLTRIQNTDRILAGPRPDTQGGVSTGVTTACSGFLTVLCFMAQVGKRASGAKARSPEGLGGSAETEQAASLPPLASP